MNLFKLAPVALAIGFAVGAGVAVASPVTVLNSDFSADGGFNQYGFDTGPGQSTAGVGVTGWTVPGACYGLTDCGTFGIAANLVPNGYPADGSYLTTPGGSTTAAYAYAYTDVTDPPGIFEQDVGPVLANTIYTLSVSVGDNPFNSGGIDAELDLLAGSTTVASKFDIDPGNGNWGTYSIFFDSASIDPSLIGQDLTIFLANNDLNNEADFSDVKLDASADPIPEPATMAIFGVGLAGLGLFRRRRAR